ncbi:MAG: glycoside hydrolase family 88 protein [Anaerolineae bacterium]|nr:glycoside hydrolase family 88 protein [Anaerolineae bacterium]
MTEKSNDLTGAVAAALQKVTANLATFSDVYPHDHTVHNIYPPRKRVDGYPAGSNVGWTTGFWPGMLWLAYELTGSPDYRQAGLMHIERFRQRLADEVDVDHHDLGFLYTLTCVAPWRLLGDTTAKDTALQAARHLLRRYLEAPGILQAWGSMDDVQQRGRAIVDSLMNLPLLYWAGLESGDAHYSRVAFRNACRLRDHLVRSDASTYHTFYFDPVTGAPLYGQTEQGATDESCWARGQAWTIYGFALSYAYTRDAGFLHAACRVADYFLEHLPQDGVAYWDLIYTDTSDEERDSSASAIAVCGLLELSKWLPVEAEARRYRAEAWRIFTSLYKHYSTAGLPASNALLLQGVYNKPGGEGINEGNLWGDYFYLEALVRLTKPDWQLYW